MFVCMYQIQLLTRGDSKQILATAFKMGHSTVTTIVNEVCEAVWEEKFICHRHKNIHTSPQINTLPKILTPCGTFQIVLVLWMESTSEYHVHPIQDHFITVIREITLLFSQQNVTLTILSRPQILGRMIPKVAEEFFGILALDKGC